MIEDILHKKFVMFSYYVFSRLRSLPCIRSKVLVLNCWASRDGLRAVSHWRCASRAMKRASFQLVRDTRGLQSMSPRSPRAPVRIARANPSKRIFLSRKKSRDINNCQWLPSRKKHKWLIIGMKTFLGIFTEFSPALNLAII